MSPLNALKERLSFDSGGVGHPGMFYRICRLLVLVVSALLFIFIFQAVRNLVALLLLVNKLVELPLSYRLPH